jgi:hypothetical protein
MSETYASLVEEWRQAAAATRQAQARVNRQFDEHLAGRASAPLDVDVEFIRQLRSLESEKLEAALRYAAKAARSPPTGFGRLGEDVDPAP